MELTKNSLELSIFLRLGAHIAMLLLVSGRINDSIQAKKSYNDIMKAFLNEFIKLKQGDKDPRNMEPVLFYISFMIGEEA